MGYTPAQVGEMSLWQFQACWDGFAMSKGVEPKPEPMSFEAFRRLKMGA